MNRDVRDFLRRAREAYVGANADALRWMLDRPPLLDAFLNTKLNSITLQDYTDAEGWRGPRILYGWIQGRGLEALATHARFFEREDPDLAARLDVAGRRLYAALSALQARHGHAYFSYDVALRPIYPGVDGEALAQAQPADLFTYSDAFVAKGLLAAAARYDPAATARRAADLLKIARPARDLPQHFG